MVDPGRSDRWCWKGNRCRCATGLSRVRIELEGWCDRMVLPAMNQLTMVGVSTRTEGQGFRTMQISIGFPRNEDVGEMTVEGVIGTTETLAWNVTFGIV